MWEKTLEILEKKWHRSPKMDKNKCPIFKNAEKNLQTGLSKMRCDHFAMNPFNSEIV